MPRALATLFTLGLLFFFLLVGVVGLLLFAGVLGLGGVVLRVVVLALSLVG